ncbi:MAG TPA: NTP transferase domain-containing protein [Thermoanaerobaculia bacterium]|nr:NTP transferase domain-containing protein [Thermoanaerobaculia bacterium]
MSAEPRRGPVAGVLLAAGTSSRMGGNQNREPQASGDAAERLTGISGGRGINQSREPQASGDVVERLTGPPGSRGINKLLLELDGEPLLRRAAGRALAAGLAPVLVVVGHEAERARDALAGLPCQAVPNPAYAGGIVTSLRAGLAAVPAEAAAAVVMLADMPFVTAEMLASLVERWRTTAAPLVISDYDGVNAPPMLYDRVLFAELLAMDDERCGKQVVKRHRHEAEVLHWPAAALADVDSPADVERVLGAAAAVRS